MWTRLPGERVRLVRLMSEAFEDGGPIPDRYVARSAGGDDVSPPLSWQGVPEDAMSLAVTVIDRHPVARDFVHWVLVGLPPTLTSVPEDASGSFSAGQELLNTTGERGWHGPNPPHGSGSHPYEFTVHALSVEDLALSRQPSAAEIERAMQGKVVDWATVTGMYER